MRLNICLLQELRGNDQRGVQFILVGAYCRYRGIVIIVRVAVGAVNDLYGFCISGLPCSGVNYGNKETPWHQRQR